MPLDEQFIGGFQPAPPSSSSPGPPDVPPKDVSYDSQTFRRNGGETNPARKSTREPAPACTSEVASITSSQLSHMTAVERSRILKVARMNPLLQFMVGPLLRYDTVDENGVWNGGALIVSTYLYLLIALYSHSINILWQRLIRALRTNHIQLLSIDGIQTSLPRTKACRNHTLTSVLIRSILDHTTLTQTQA